MVEPQTIYATAIDCAGQGVALRGPSGVGKTDLALRCLCASLGPLAPAPFQLVADDRVQVVVRDGYVELAAPAATRGLVEVRGVGIIKLPEQLVVGPDARSRLTLVVDLASRAPERLPPTPLPLVDIAGVGVPCLQLAGFEASTPLKIALALAGLGSCIW
ncbi:MAG: aldolase [Hyphomicrobiaceae bacterium]